ncbi:MAG: hypothetical protein C4322_17225, partial [Mastigocladus sp. ERB_26_1]
FISHLTLSPKIPNGFYIVGVKFYGMQPWFFGVSAEGIGTLGMLINFVVTWSVSRLTPPPPLEVQEMVEVLRTPGDEPPAIEELDEDHLD